MSLTYNYINIQLTREMKGERRFKRGVALFNSIQILILKSTFMYVIYKFLNIEVNELK